MSDPSKSDIDKSLSIAVRSGKILFGSNATIKNVMAGRVRLVIVAYNCPSDMREKIKYYCKLSNTPFIIYPGSSLDLGAACRKPFLVASLAVRDPGDSDILNLSGGENV